MPPQTKAQRLKGVQLLADACSDVAHLMRKPITADRLVKLYAKLKASMHSMEPFGITGPICQAGAPADVAGIWVPVEVGRAAVKAKIVPLLVRMMRWLGTPAGMALWRQYEAARVLKMWAMAHLKALLILECEVFHEAAVREAALEVQRQLQTQVHEAGEP